MQECRLGYGSAQSSRCSSSFEASQSIRPDSRTSDAGPGVMTEPLFNQPVTGLAGSNVQWTKADRQSQEDSSGVHRGERKGD
jgi:hypothetical protein